MTAYYNEHDPKAAAWLRELIGRNLIAPGIIDERSIEDVRPDELVGFTQCHFFAGIGVWSHSLRRAGWGDDRPIWTGSCPCQPFSAAGKGEGFADERHLWPSFFHLIEQCEPPVVLGEQVAGGGVGVWFDLVQADLEAMGYAFGLVPLPAAGFGGAHIRDRAFWVADATSCGQSRQGWGGGAQEQRIAELRGIGGMADALRNGAEHHTGAGLGEETAPHGGDGSVSRERLRAGLEGPPCERPGAPMLGRNPADWLLCRDGKWRPVEPGTFPLAHEAPARVGRLRGYGNAIDAETASTFIEALMAAQNFTPQREVVGG